jgi:hypothetical protein
LATGIDPGEVKKAEKRASGIAAANTFEVIAREWFNARCQGARCQGDPMADKSTQ